MCAVEEKNRHVTGGALKLTGSLLLENVHLVFCITFASLCLLAKYAISPNNMWKDEYYIINARATVGPPKQALSL